MCLIPAFKKRRDFSWNKWIEKSKKSRKSVWFKYLNLLNSLLAKLMNNNFKNSGVKKDIIIHWDNFNKNNEFGEVAERSNATDCKSVGSGLRRFESSPPHNKPGILSAGFFLFPDYSAQLYSYPGKNPK